MFQFTYPSSPDITEQLNRVEEKLDQILLDIVKTQPVVEAPPEPPGPRKAKHGQVWQGPSKNDQLVTLCSNGDEEQTYAVWADDFRLSDVYYPPRSAEIMYSNLTYAGYKPVGIAKSLSFTL